MINRLLIFLALFSFFTPYSLLAESPPISISLVPQFTRISRQGFSQQSQFSVGVQFHVQDGWHIYWKEPGRFGLPTTLSLEVNGKPYSVQSELWPAPSVKLHEDGEASFEYARSFSVILGPVGGEEIDGDSVELSVKGKWLACSNEVCVPKKGEASYSIGLGEELGPPNPQFTELSRALPGVTVASLLRPVKLSPDGTVVRVNVGTLGEESYRVVAHGGPSFRFQKGYLEASRSEGQGRVVALTFKGKGRDEKNISKVSGFLLTGDPATSIVFEAN